MESKLKTPLSEEEKKKIDLLRAKQAWIEQNKQFLNDLERRRLLGMKFILFATLFNTVAIIFLIIHLYFKFGL